jgi:hypothetical protein
VNALRSRFGAEFDAQRGEQTAQALQKLNDQIELEHQLAQAEYAGAAAVRQVELAHKLAQIARDNDVRPAQQKLIKAEQELAATNRDVEIAADVAKINERTTATERLAAATLKGAEAVRQASLQNKLAEIAREGDTLAPGLIGDRPARTSGTSAMRKRINALQPSRS